MNRVLSAVRAGAPLWRSNWELRTPTDAALAHPSLRPQGAARGQLDAQEARDLPPADLWLRVEFQTFVKLPQSGAVLFTVRTHTDPLAALERCPAAAENLVAMLDELSAPMAEYKGIGDPSTREGVRQLLQSFAAPC